MSWLSLSKAQRIEIILQKQAEGLTQKLIAAELGTIRENVRDFCRRQGILGWKQGAQEGNTNAQLAGGMGRNTIRRKTQKILITEGRDRFICERCNSKSASVAYPVHHKDRNRANNTRSNLEVLCNTCHAREHIVERTRNELGQLCNIK